MKKLKVIDLSKEQIKKILEDESKNINNLEEYEYNLLNEMLEHCFINKEELMTLTEFCIEKDQKRIKNDHTDAYVELFTTIHSEENNPYWNEQRNIDDDHYAVEEELD